MTQRIRRGGNSEDYQLMFLGDVDTGGDGSTMTDGLILSWNEAAEKFLPISPVAAAGLTANITASLNAAASPNAANPFLVQDNTRDLLVVSDAPHDWWLATGTGTFEGHVDDVLMFGYNITGNGGRRVDGDYVWYMGFERDYYTSPTAHQAEWYIRYADGVVQRYPISCRVVHTDHTSYVTVAGKFQVTNDDSSLALYSFLTNGTLALDGATKKVFASGSDNFYLQSESGRVYVIASSQGYWFSPTAYALYFSDDTYLFRPSVKVMNTNGKFTADEGLGAGNSAANTNTPSGATARQLPIYAANGSTLLGYIPIYASAW